MKIGFLGLPLAGHLNPMTALARKLQSRGEKVVFFGIPDSESTVRSAGLPFVPMCEDEYPPGSVARLWGPIASMHGLDVMRYALGTIHSAFLQASFQHLPGILGKAGIGGMVVDAAYALIELVPLSLDLPFVQVWTILHPDPSGTTPPIVLSWPYETTSGARARNLEGLQKFSTLFAPLVPVARAYAEQTGLAVDWSDPGGTASRLAILTQTPKEFDFPGIPRPPHFHHAGPFHDGTGREPIPFAWNRLDERPLIYASLGTLVNNHPKIYRAILGAAAHLPDVQLVLSVGTAIALEDLGPIPPNVFLVPTAPQQELLARAVLCITHAGLNTTLESLAKGVPMVAIPIGYDQPGVAARIAFHGLGEVLELENLCTETLLTLIRQVLGDLKYRENARNFQNVIQQTNGLEVAADAIQKAFA